MFTFAVAQCGVVSFHVPVAVPNAGILCEGAERPRMLAACVGGLRGVFTSGKYRRAVFVGWFPLVGVVPQ
eukprot:3118636-Amphidinium_carterae.1